MPCTDRMEDRRICIYCKSQSAMEYLMTYGWSILIVAVVLGALAYLGVFNPLYFAPKANPGSCQVFRPNGAGTSYDINLLGTCNGEIPEYVAQFNGQSSYINFGTEYLPIGSESSSGFAWIYFDGSTGSVPFAYGNSGTGSNAGIVYTYTSSSFIQACFFEGGYCGSAAPQIQPDGWHFVGYVFSSENPGEATVYIDGVPTTWGLYFRPVDVVAEELSIGKQPACSCSYFAGMIADLQIYNTSLDYASVNALYREGIGGAPIDLQNLVGWWPLNGNANDYSGNGNNGAPANVVYASSWINGYTQAS